MKIAYIFSYLGDGGSEEYAFLLAKEAKKAGNSVTFIISSSSSKAHKRLVAEKHKVILLPMESSFNPIAVLSSVLNLKKIIKSEQIDIVHANMLREQSLAIFAKMLGAKFRLVRTFHRQNSFNWKMKPLLPIYLRYTDAIISISNTMSGLLDQYGWGNHYTLIENGVPKVDASKHSKALGFIGRLTDEKGILQFIKANIKFLRNNKLIIAGDGENYDAIKQVTDKNNLDIELLGSISDKAEFYKKISVLLLPSSHEVLALVGLEAYSCGLPILAFNIAPMRDLVEYGNGILVEAFDYVQMGKEAKKLLATADKYSKFNIDTYNTKYSVDIMWSKTYALYQSLLYR